MLPAPPVLTSVGASELAYFAGLSAAGAAYHRCIPQRTNGASPTFRGSVEKFVEKHPALAAQFRNEARSCPGCGKSCATILPFCNGCGRGLADAPVQFTENVCMAFVYGIERGSRFPLGLSLRLETPDVIVYDDLLSRGSCHLNAIPSDSHLPDWRQLLRNPAKALKLLRRLDDASWSVVREQFWDDEVWRHRTFREGAFQSPEHLRAEMYAGINSVPSQFQVHLQYIAPGIQPVDYHNFLFGKRFVKDRWLPLEYVYSSLEALSLSGGLPSAHTMTMEDIFDAIQKIGGPSYATAHAQAIRRYNRTHCCCANWRPEHFDVVVLVRHPALRPEIVGAAPDSESAEAENVGTVATELRPMLGSALPPGATVVELERRDKLAIQSYGRPYSSEGRPQALSFYSFAKLPGQVATPDEWVAAAI